MVSKRFPTRIEFPPNTNITLGLFLGGKEETIESIAGEEKEKITETMKSFWERIPVSKTSKEKKRDGVIVVSSVKPVWEKVIKQIIEAPKVVEEKTKPLQSEVVENIEVKTEEPSSIIEQVAKKSNPVAVTGKGQQRV